MKKILCLFAAIAMLTATAFAASEVKGTIEGGKLTLDGTGVVNNTLENIMGTKVVAIVVDPEEGAPYTFTCPVGYVVVDRHDEDDSTYYQCLDRCTETFTLGKDVTTYLPTYTMEEGVVGVSYSGGELALTLNGSLVRDTSGATISNLELVETGSVMTEDPGATTHIVEGGSIYGCRDSGHIQYFHTFPTSEGYYTTPHCYYTYTTSYSQWGYPIYDVDTDRPYESYYTNHGTTMQCPFHEKTCTISTIDEANHLYMCHDRHDTWLGDCMWCCPYYNQTTGLSDCKNHRECTITSVWREEFTYKVQTNGTTKVTGTDYYGDGSVTSVSLVNVNTGGVTISPSVPVVVNGGVYSGAPAFGAGMSVLVNEGTLVNTDGSMLAGNIAYNASTTACELEQGEDGSLIYTFTPKATSGSDGSSGGAVAVASDYTAPSIVVNFDHIMRNRDDVEKYEWSSVPCSTVRMTVTITDMGLPDTDNYIDVYLEYTPYAFMGSAGEEGEAYPIPLHDGTPVAQGTVVFELSEEWKDNGTITITAVDAAGNSSSVTYTVDCIDFDEPFVTSITPSTTAWTNKSIYVTVVGEDDYSLHPWPYAVNQTSSASNTGTSWKTNAPKGRFTIAENGTYYAHMRDLAGNTTSVRFDITNIDKDKPVITSTYMTDSKTYLLNPSAGFTLSVIGSDALSGLHSSPYHWVGTVGTTVTDYGWTSQNVINVFDAGTYTIEIRDQAGNVSDKKTFTVVIPSADGPVIDSWGPVGYDVPTAFYSGYRSGGVTLAVSASAGTFPLTTSAYTYSDGPSRTNATTIKVYEPGEYWVYVEDTAGNVTSAMVTVTGLDNQAPIGSAVAAMETVAGESVTKLSFNWSDNVGIYSVKALWKSSEKEGYIYHKAKTSSNIITDTGATLTDTSGSWTFEVEETGNYTLEITDYAGNVTYLEKAVVLPVKAPTASDSQVVVTVLGDPRFGSSPTRMSDIVYGPTKAYVVDTLKDDSGKIQVKFTFNGAKDTYVKAYATFCGQTDNTVILSGSSPVAGLSVTSAGGITGLVEFNVSSCADIKNGSLVIVVQEFRDSSCEELIRDGSATTYVSVQVTPPTITTQFLKTENRLVVVANSTVAGVASLKYRIGTLPSVGTTPYTEPLDLTSYVGTSQIVSLTATDKVGLTTTKTVSIGDILTNPDTSTSLPTTDVNGSNVNVYYVGSRTSEIYIIGGTRNNTKKIPIGSLFGGAS